MPNFQDTREKYLIEASRRREKAKKLRAEGKSFGEIGRLLGVSRQRAYAMTQP